jgi:alkylhydroperoxidase/carboxymuconolactone decarboxylase family protein YurZ
MTESEDLLRRSKAYLDRLFGAGAGEKHAVFLDHLEHRELREMLHRYHAMEANTEHLSVEENYLIGMSVLLAQRAYGPASMFAKTLLHLGTKKEKLLEAVARLSMWIGGVPAAEAAAYVQRAIREYEEHGLASMAAWFPEKK